MRTPILGVSHYTFAVEDSQAWERFLCGALGVPAPVRRGRATYYRAGSDWLVLRRVTGPLPSPHPENHLALRVRAEALPALLERLRRHHVAIIAGPARRGPSIVATLQAPEGHRLEIHSSGHGARLGRLQTAADARQSAAATRRP